MGTGAGRERMCLATLRRWKSNLELKTCFIQADSNGEKRCRKRGRERGNERGPSAKETGSQTDEDNLSCNHNMAATIEAINQKLDLALSKFQEIDVLKKVIAEETI